MYTDTIIKVGSDGISTQSAWVRVGHTRTMRCFELLLLLLLLLLLQQFLFVLLDSELKFLERR